ncbi:hypothetical protein BD779DRAFT_1492955, partial [Infundibulicybe gibba]
MICSVMQPRQQSLCLFALLHLSRQLPLHQLIPLPPRSFASFHESSNICACSILARDSDNSPLLQVRPRQTPVV